jgi:hypothetical protein
MYERGLNQWLAASVRLRRDGRPTLNVWTPPELDAVNAEEAPLLFEDLVREHARDLVHAVVLVEVRGQALERARLGSRPGERD